MSQRFLRRVKVTLATDPSGSGKYFNHYTQVVDVENLRVTFMVEKNLERKNNKGKVQIYNLAERTRAIFQRKPANLILQAGYESGIAQIYRGDVFYASNENPAPDWVTTVECGTGVNFTTYARSFVSMKAKADPVAMAKKLASEAGLGIANLDQAKDFFGKIQSGMVLEGPTLAQIEKLAKVGGGTTRPTIQDDQLVFLRDQDALQASAIVLSPETGMIGSPEFGAPEKKRQPPTITVHSVLSADLKPGGLVKVISKTGTGVYKIQRVVHKGDTHGNDWMSTIEGKYFKGAA